MALFSTAILAGNIADRPASGDALLGGRLYFALDEDKVYRDNGTSWDEMLDASGAGSGLPNSGWVALGETLVYASADDPTYTVTCSGVDLTGTLSVGMKLRVSQSTGGTKYFFITAISFSTDTTITLYGGTDYDMANEAISSPVYSIVKAPFGFPLDPAKWTVEVTDTTERSQGSPTQNTWYNLGSVNIVFPIGTWRDAGYDAAAGMVSTAGNRIMQTTLSTANNTESDADFTARSGAAGAFFGDTFSRRKTLVLAAKTTYYFNTRTLSTSVTTLYNTNDQAKLILSAVCAYL